jgi:hypothetical protein
MKDLDGIRADFFSQDWQQPQKHLHEAVPKRRRELFKEEGLAESPLWGYALQVIAATQKRILAC